MSQDAFYEVEIRTVKILTDTSTYDKVTWIHEVFLTSSATTWSTGI